MTLNRIKASVLMIAIFCSAMIAYSFASRTASADEPADIAIVSHGQGQAIVIVPQRFDSEIKGWTPPGTTVAGKVSVAADKQNSGNYSLHIKDEDNRNYGAESSLVAINSGESYTASAMVHAESGANPAIMIYYYDSSKQLIAYPYAVGGTVGQWTALSVTGVAPTNAAYASVVLFSDTSGVRSVYFDDVVLKNAANVSLPLDNPGFEDISDSAAEMLAEYIRRSTTVELPVIAETKLREEDELYTDVTRIYVGGRVPTGDAVLDQMLAGLNNDEFVIQIKDKKIAIVGSTSAGTTLGVKEYLKFYVGVIWPAPGISEYVPELSSILSPWTTVN